MPPVRVHLVAALLVAALLVAALLVPALLVPALLVAACHKNPSGRPAGDDTADTAVPDETACPEAEARLGYPACEHRVPDDDTFTALTIASSSVDQVRVGKYLVPARDDSRLPTVWLYAGTFPLHYEFLVTAFPDLFSGLSTDEYEQLILYPDTRTPTPTPTTGPAARTRPPGWATIRGRARWSPPMTPSTAAVSTRGAPWRRSWPRRAS